MMKPINDIIRVLRESGGKADTRTIAQQTGLRSDAVWRYAEDLVRCGACSRSIPAPREPIVLTLRMDSESDIGAAFRRWRKARGRSPIGLWVSKERMARAVSILQLHDGRITAGMLGDRMNMNQRMARRLLGLLHILGFVTRTEHAPSNVDWEWIKGSKLCDVINKMDESKAQTLESFTHSFVSDDLSDDDDDAKEVTAEANDAWLAMPACRFRGPIDGPIVVPPGAARSVFDLGRVMHR